MAADTAAQRRQARPAAVPADGLPSAGGALHVRQRTRPAPARRACAGTGRRGAHRIRPNDASLAVSGDVLHLLGQMTVATERVTEKVK